MMEFSNSMFAQSESKIEEYAEIFQTRESFFGTMAEFNNWNSFCAAYTKALSNKILILNLRGLYLNFPKIIGLAEALKQHNPQTLILARNLISLEGIRIILQALTPNNIIESLDLMNNCLEDSGCISLIAQFLKDNSSLKILNLAGNKLNSHSIFEFENAFSLNSTLEHLDLGKNRIDDLGLDFLCSSLIHNNSLKTLLVYSNSFGTAKCLNNLVGTTAIENIDISYNYYQIRAESFCNLISHPSIRSLNLKAGNILFWPDNIICEPSNLKELYLCYTSSTSTKFGSSFVNSVLNSIALEVLTLSHCFLTSSFIENFQIKNLKHLDLSSNPIQDEGIAILSHKLLECERIETLELSNCRMTNVGLLKILEALITKASLVNVDLSDNNFDGLSLPMLTCIKILNVKSLFISSINQGNNQPFLRGFGTGFGITSRKIDFKNFNMSLIDKKYLAKLTKFSALDIKGLSLKDLIKKL